MHRKLLSLVLLIELGLRRQLLVGCEVFVECRNLQVPDGDTRIQATVEDQVAQLISRHLAVRLEHVRMLQGVQALLIVVLLIERLMVR